MSVLSKEITSYFKNIQSHSDGRITATISFPAGFTGFKGHFPGNPVVPGVCLVLSIVVLLNSVRPNRLKLKTIQTAKFLSVIGCDQEINVELRYEPDPQANDRAKALFLSADKKIADIHIEVIHE